MKMNHIWMRTTLGYRARVAFMALCCTALAAAAAEGQERLTLDEAVTLARQNNPNFLSTENDRGAAAWQERAAYGAFLPRADASASAGYTEAGTQRIGTLDFGSQSTDWYSSSYNVGLTWTLDGNTIFGVSNARNSRRATDARVDAAAFDLESGVAFQYMTALRARDQLDVAQRQLDRARQNLRIVTTRVSSGAAAGTEGKQAEVDLGRAEVGLIQAERDLRLSKLLLAEQIGVSLPPDVELVSEFAVFEPDFDVAALVDAALNMHPSLNAFRAQENARRAAARQTTTSQYLPTVTLQTGFRGNTLQALNEEFLLTSAEDRVQGQRESCEFQNAISAGLTSPLPGYPRNCSEFVMTDAMRRDIISSNDVFPFNFTTLPLSLSLRVSVPIFTGFSRQTQVAQANAAAEDAEHDRRAEELRLRTAVTSAADNLESAYRVLQAEERNLTLAEEQLLLQQRRYSLGAAALLELLDAQTTMTTADQAYLNALYDFHYSLIQLEAAVGRSLRDG
ncbi:MAG: TolC family protein [Gemmatimonadota bacterium]